MTGGTSFEYLDRHARETPDRIAVTGQRGQIDWARFRADAGRAAQALQGLGAQPGQIAVISHPDPYLHWVLAIACDAVGIVSASLGPGDADEKQLRDLADLVLSEESLAGHWAEGELRRRPPDPDAPVRIIRTSGSTGMPKCLILTRRMLDHWVDSTIALSFRGQAPRYYSAYPLTVNPNHYRMEACLRLGGTVILGQASQDLVTFEATDCWLLPRDMATLLQSVQGGWPSPRPLHMNLGGGPVSAELHDATAALFGTEVTILYGINEAGRISVADREGVHRLLPDVDLRIVDESGRDLPTGETGRIVVRTSGTGSGYLNDPEASAEHFRDGWFFTEDIGVRLADGRLRIVGRRSEVINLGGVKISPFPMEQKLRAAIPALREVVVTSIHGAQGFEEICIAVVPDPAADRSALVAAIQAEIDPSIGRVWLRLFERLPVGASGKIQRAALRDIFAAVR